MSLVKIETHAEDAVARLIAQFKEKPRIEALLMAFAAEYQSLEDSIFSLPADRALATAVGEQLDLFGTIVGELRRGRNDDDYRLALYARIARNTSRGTYEDLIRVFNLITGTPASLVVDLFPASVGIFATSDISALDVVKILEICQSVIPGGVKLFGVGMLPVGDGTFFAFEGPDPRIRGFGDANDPAVGGGFATLLAVP